MKKEIDSWYARFSKENGLSLVDARRILNNRELKDFKMTLKEYVKKAKEANMSEDHRRMLENASIKKRLDRSQMIYIQMAQLMEELATTNKEELADILADVYEDSYYRSAYAVQSRTRYQNLNALPTDDVKKIIQQPWAGDGKEFSARIWQDRRTLVIALEHELAYSLLAGKGTTYMAEAIERRMGTSYRNAKRLVETEVAYIHERAILDMYDELDVEKLQIIATLDSKTSQVCRSLDKTVVNKEDAVPGKTVPPFHCYCRSTTAPYFEGLDGEVRAARDENGKTVYVDGDLNYETWKNGYVKFEQAQAKPHKITQKDGGMNEYKVNRDIVNSASYRAAFDRMPFPKAVRDNLHKHAIDILEENDGKPTETIIILDAKTGKFLARSPVNNDVFHTRLDKKAIDIVDNHKGDIIVLHNHPKGDCFSLTDLRSYFARSKVAGAVVVGHPGDVHLVYDFDRTVDIDKLYSDLYNASKRKYNSDILAYPDALSGIYTKGVFKYEKVDTRRDDRKESEKRNL